MNLATIIVLGIVAIAAIGAIVWMVIERKMRGRGCLGCPFAGSCSKKC